MQTAKQITGKLRLSAESESEQNSKHDWMLKRANRVWDRMQEMFGSVWISQFGDAPEQTINGRRTMNRTWVQGLAIMTDEQIINGLRVIADTAREFPPNWGQFKAACLQSPDSIAAYHKQLPYNPPETDEHRAQRIERCKHHSAALKQALKTGKLEDLCKTTH